MRLREERSGAVLKFRVQLWMSWMVRLVGVVNWGGLGWGTYGCGIFVEEHFESCFVFV